MLHQFLTNGQERISNHWKMLKLSEHCALKKSSNIDKPVKPAPKWASNGKEPEEEEMTPEEAEAFFNGH